MAVIGSSNKRWQGRVVGLHRTLETVGRNPGGRKA